MAQCWGKSEGHSTRPFGGPQGCCCMRDAKPDGPCSHLEVGEVQCKKATASAEEGPWRRAAGTRQRHHLVEGPIGPAEDSPAVLEGRSPLLRTQGPSLFSNICTSLVPSCLQAESPQVKQHTQEQPRARPGVKQMPAPVGRLCPVLALPALAWITHTRRCPPLGCALCCWPGSPTSTFAASRSSEPWAQPLACTVPASVQLTFRKRPQMWYSRRTHQLK